MLRVQFNGSNAVHKAEFHLVSSSSVRLTGKNIPCSTSGFKVFRLNGEFLGDYSDFINAEETENGVRFSK